MLTSNSEEITEFAGQCLENYNSAQIAAGPLTAKGMSAYPSIQDI
jgi:hypothetical protein